MNAIVFFAAYRCRRVGWRRSVRICARKPRLAADWALARLVRILTGSELVHVSIAYNGQVLDPTIRGNTIYPVLWYVEKHPFLVACFTVPVGKDPRLITFSTGRRKRALPTFIRWCFCGLSRAPGDCVSVVSACLRTAGIHVPMRLVTPAQLHDWLERQGFERTNLE